MRRAARPAAALLLAALLLSVAPACAHTRSQSRSSWLLTDGGASATFVASAYDATRLVVEASFDELAGLYAMHLSHTVSVSRGGRECEPVRTAALPAEPGFVRAEVVVRCPSAGPTRVRIASFFESAPSHVHIADVRHAGAAARAARDYLFTDGSREHVFEPGDIDRGVGIADLATAALRYVRLGATHILAGSDHLAFLAALLLLCRGFGAVIWMVSGFTVGHSLTLAATVLGLVDPDARAIEVLIGFTIAVSAVEGSIAGAPSARRAAFGCGCVLTAMAVSSLFVDQRIGPLGWMALAVFACCHLLARPGWSSSPVANASLSAVFGLVHGFGFASVLVDMDLPAQRLVLALAGFNVGVELGQLVVVAGLWACVLGLRRLLDGEARGVLAEHATAALCGLGIFWMISRSLLG